MGELKLYQIEAQEVSSITSYAYLRTYCIYAHSEAEAMADADKILAKWSEELGLLSMQRLSVKEVQPHRHVMLIGQMK